MPDTTAQIANAIQQQWELQLPETVTEEELLRILAQRVKLLLERGTEPFFQLMYRLDIPEHKLYDAMNTGDAPHAIAHLIYQRQLEKIQSRLINKTEANEDDFDLRW
jgi:hypothetical protein